MCAGKTAPCHNWRNPVERIMSIVNVGLQCVGMMRRECSKDFEAAIKKCNNLNQLRKSVSLFKEEVKSTLQPPIELLSNILEHLKLKDDIFQVFESYDDNKLDVVWEILEQVDSSLSRADTTQDAIKTLKDIQQFLSHCCQARKYSFCIKKCGSGSCKICKPVRMDHGVFDTLRHLPDPSINLSEPEHYLSFD